MVEAWHLHAPRGQSAEPPRLALRAVSERLAAVPAGSRNGRRPLPWSSWGRSQRRSGLDVPDFGSPSRSMGQRGTTALRPPRLPRSKGRLGRGRVATGGQVMTSAAATQQELAVRWRWTSHQPSTRAHVVVAGLPPDALGGEPLQGAIEQRLPRPTGGEAFLESACDPKLVAGLQEHAGGPRWRPRRRRSAQSPVRRQRVATGSPGAGVASCLRPAMAPSAPMPVSERTISS